MVGSGPLEADKRIGRIIKEGQEDEKNSSNNKIMMMVIRLSR